MAVNKIKIVHLYPDELNLYGDSGNVLCLYQRLRKRHFGAEILPVGIGEKIPEFDILFIGGGQDKEMKIIAPDLRRKSDMLSYCIKSGKTLLAICGGYQILGEYYKTYDGSVMKLSGALPFCTVGGKERMIGNFVFETPFGSVAGFENHSGKTYLDKSLSPLGRIISGFGNNGSDGGEGLLYKNTFCTYAHGPVLPKNPVLADEIIRRATGINNLEAIDDAIENACHDQLVKRFG